MKKIISLFSGAILAFGIGASAEVASYTPGLIYNTEVKQFENIQNIDGRVFIPLRAVFEMMGATVDYDNATTKVTVTREGKIVTFLREDTKMTVTDSSGVTTEIPAEIKFDYKTERVIVPVRFISQALDARVGWNSDERCVYVLDTYPMLQSIKTDCPNLLKLMEKTANLEKNVKSDMTMGLDFDFSVFGENLKADLDLNTEKSSFGTDTLASAKINLVHENLDLLTDGYKLGPVEDVTFDLIKTLDAIYVKTNAGSKISTILPDQKDLHIAESIVTDDTWFRLDYSFVEKEYGKQVADLIFKDGEPIADAVTLSPEESLEATLKVLGTALSQSTEDVTYDEMYAVKTYFDTLKGIFNKFVIEEVDADTFNVKFDLTLDDLLTIMNLRSAYLTDEEYNAAVGEIKNALTFSVSANESYKNGVAEKENANVTMIVKDELIGIDLSLILTIDGKSEKLTKKPEFSLPENSISVETIMTLLK